MFFPTNKCDRAAKTRNNIHCYTFLDVPQFKHSGRCIQIKSPQAVQTHRVFSFLMNCLIPIFSICIRFSIMLMPYFVRYLGTCFHEEQYISFFGERYFHRRHEYRRTVQNFVYAVWNCMVDSSSLLARAEIPRNSTLSL